MPNRDKKAIVAAFILVLAAATPARAAGHDLQIEIRPCFRRLKYDRDDRLIAYDVSVRNRGDDYTGTLKWNSTFNIFSDLVLSDVVVPVSAKKGQDLRFFMYLPVADRGKLILMAPRDSDVDLTEKLVTPEVRGNRWNWNESDNRTHIDVLAIGRTGAPVSMKNENTQTFFETVIVYGGRAEIAGLPQTWYAYAPFEAIVLDDRALRHLGPAQKTALSEWVIGGGSLAVILTDRDTPRDALFDNLVDLSVDSQITQEEGGAVARFIQIGGQKPAGYSNSDRWVFQAGFGHLFFIPFDPTAPAPSGTERQKRLHEFYQARFVEMKSLRDSTLLRGDLNHEKRDNVNTVAYNSVAYKAKPHFLFIMLFFAGYIVLAGPVNFAFMRKLKRPQFIALTIPAVSFVFIVLTYFTGFLLNPNLLKAEAVSLTRIAGPHNAATGTAYLGLLPAIPAVFTLKSEPSQELERIWPDARFTGSETPMTCTINGVEFRDFGLANWGAVVFRARRRQALDGGVGVTLLAGAPGRAEWQFSVENNLTRDLAEGAVVYRHSAARNLYLFRIDGVAAGEKKTFVVKPTVLTQAGRKITNIGRKLGWLAALPGHAELLADLFDNYLVLTKFAVFRTDGPPVDYFRLEPDIDVRGTHLVLVELAEK